MDDQRLAVLDQALSISEDMVAAANAGEWDRVSTLQNDCDACLRDGFPTNDAARERLLAVQEAYNTLRLLTYAAREKTADQLGQHRQSHRALAAYLQPLEDG